MKEMNEKQECGRSLNGIAIKAVTLILMIMFFFPLCTVSCGSNTKEINGVEATFGLEVLGEHIDGNILCGLLFLLPLVILITLLIKKQVTKSIALFVGVIGLFNGVFLLIFRSRVIKLAEEALATVKFAGGYYAEIICNIILIVFALLSYQGWILLYNQGKISVHKNIEESRRSRNNASIAVIGALLIAYALIGFSLFIFDR